MHFTLGVPGTMFDAVNIAVPESLSVSVIPAADAVFAVFDVLALNAEREVVTVANPASRNDMAMADSRTSRACRLGRGAVVVGSTVIRSAPP